jgi:nitroimidazol reductase NimA-like FMN-containing flavoprotein (pyridoxamine 5'-phosphate oxidase superfamily)
MDSPNIGELSPEEIAALLERNHVGRIAYSMHDRVNIEPISYVHSGGWLYGRTSLGAKLATLEKNKWVAFEVDEVTSLFEWQSVVVHGGIYILEPEVPPGAKNDWADALTILRRLLPATFREDDPVPFRDIVFRIAVQETTGKRSARRVPRSA